jgi:hypothetical protein
MADLAVQAVHELATRGRLSPETDYAVRDELDLVAEEEREAHEEAEDKEGSPDVSSSAAKPPVPTSKKGN